MSRGTTALISAVILCIGLSAHAQTSVPPNRAGNFKDTSILVPPKGVKVAILEFDDLECPTCAKALPLIQAAAQHYKVPVLHHDFPLTEVHIWSFDAAVTARYLQDAVSHKLSDDFRAEVFSHQTAIANKDDLAKFTAKWFQDHKLRLPRILDPKGIYAGEVKADRALADKMGLRGTPTIFVLTQHGWIQVLDWYKLDATVGQAVADSAKK